jgi:hypothetical protein
MSSARLRLLACLLLLIFALPVTAEPPTDWVWQNPLPQGNKLDAVWGRSATEVYAIGGQQTLMRWDGNAWSVAERPTSWPIFDLWGLDNGVIFAAGYGGTVLRFDGVSWTEIPTDFDDHLVSILAFSETDIYVAEQFPGRDIRHYDGVEWTNIGTAPGGIHDLGGSGPGDIYVVGFEGMMTHYDGAMWTPVPGFPFSDITSVWSNASDDVFALQFGSQLFHFDGIDWTLVGSDTTGSYFSDMWSTSSSNVWFVDANGGLSHYDGTDVTEYDLPNDGLLGVWGDSLGNVHAAGAHGSLLSFDGNTWTPHSSAAAYEKLNAVWGLSPDNLYAVGSLEVVLHYDGMEWTKIHPTQFSVWFNDIWASSSLDVFAVGKRGVRHFDGVEWTAMDDGLRHLLLPHNGVWGFGPEDLVAVGDWGAIIRFDGVEWTIVRDPDPDLGELFDVWGAAPDDIWAVGPQNEFLHWDGTVWNVKPVTTSGQQTEIIGWASDDILVLGEGGELFHYDGVAWTLNEDMVGQGIVSIHGTSSSDLYALAGFGYVWHFDGSSWTYVDTWVRTSLTSVWAAKNDGGVFAVGQGSSIIYGANSASAVPEFTVGQSLNLRSEPNPFNPSTNLRFEMPRAGRATLVIHDASGRRIVTLIDRDVEAGLTTVRWDGRDQAGRRQASGVYFASVKTELGRAVQKVTLVK